MRTGLTKQEKTTDIWFDEKDPLIYIRTHNTDLKKRLAAYGRTDPRQYHHDPEERADHCCGVVFQSKQHRNIPRQAAQTGACRQYAFIRI